jgi:dTMP kinase
MAKKGIFITLEGTDGVGKTSHCLLLKIWLKKRRIKVLLTREPGGGSVSEKIRKILLDPKTKIEDLTELFLYQAARVEHVEKIIQPALKKGTVVICDRFTDATVAYQGFARGIPLSTIQILNQIATGGLVPDLTLWLDHPPKQALKKARARNKKRDRLENQGFHFQQKVRKGYLAQFRKNPRRVVRVPVQESIQKTQAMIQQIIFKRFFR